MVRMRPEIPPNPKKKDTRNSSGKNILEAPPRHFTFTSEMKSTPPIHPTPGVPVEGLPQDMVSLGTKKPGIVAGCWADQSTSSLEMSLTGHMSLRDGKVAL